MQFAEPSLLIPSPILPDSRANGYGEVLGSAGAEKLKNWIAQGGTLVTFASATIWLTEEGVQLLSSQREVRGGEQECPTGEPKQSEAKSGVSIDPVRELPLPTPGAIVRVELDEEHWLAAGYGKQIDVLFEGRSIFTPLKLDRGSNVGVFAEQDVLVSRWLRPRRSQAAAFRKSVSVPRAHSPKTGLDIPDPN